MFSPQRTQRAQRSWDGEKGERWRATTNTGLSRQSLRDYDAAALRHGLSRCATRQRITAASTLRVCHATRARKPSSRHTKTPASQATRIPRQICRVFEAKKTGDLGLGIWYNIACRLRELFRPHSSPTRTAAEGRQDRPSVANRSLRTTTLQTDKTRLARRYPIINLGCRLGVCLSRLS